MAKEQLFTREKKDVWLKWYARCGRCGESSKAAGTTNSTVNQHRKLDPDFDAECVEAYSLYRESLEREIERRAVEGTLDPIFQRGVLVGHRRMFSDALILAHARRHIPEYREKHSVDVNVAGGVLVVPGVAKDSHEWENGGSESDEEKG